MNQCGRVSADDLKTEGESLFRMNAKAQSFLRIKKLSVVVVVEYDNDFCVHRTRMVTKSRTLLQYTFIH